MVKVQNCGYLSDPINVERSVHQGGCASAFLFNVLAETMANELRMNLIEPIVIKQHHHSLSQYADDTHLFSHHSQQSLDVMIEELDRLEHHTGLRVNL